MARRLHSKIDPARRVAYHEAGHAVAAYVLRQRFRNATIEMTEAFDGLVPMIGLDDILGKLEGRTRDSMFMTANGPAAESRFMRQGRRSFIGSYDDFGLVLRILGKLSGSSEEANAYANWLFERAKNLVSWEPNWTMAGALVKALEGAKTLPYADARRIMGTPESPFR